MRVQKVDESIDDYVTDLKIKARNCNFGDLKDEMIRDKIICGITSEQIRGRLLKQGDIYHWIKFWKYVGPMKQVKDS